MRDHIEWFGAALESTLRSRSNSNQAKWADFESVLYWIMLEIEIICICPYEWILIHILYVFAYIHALN